MCVCVCVSPPKMTITAIKQTEPHTNTHISTPQAPPSSLNHSPPPHLPPKRERDTHTHTHKYPPLLLLLTGAWAVRAPRWEDLPPWTCHIECLASLVPLLHLKLDLFARLFVCVCVCVLVGVGVILGGVCMYLWDC